MVSNKVQTTGNTQKHKGQIRLCKKISGKNKKDSQCIGMMGREESGEGIEQLMIQSIPHYVSKLVEPLLQHGHLWLPMAQAVTEGDYSEGMANHTK